MVKLTRQEKKTAVMKERMKAHVADWFSSYTDRDKYPYQDFNYVTTDKPFEVWTFEYGQKDDGNTESIWLLWNGEEFISAHDPSEVIVELTTQRRERESRRNLKYWTSPLAVAAIIAILLTVVVGVLAYFGKAPPELWTIFTAVIAFYFGRSNPKAAAAQEEDE